MAFRAKFSKKSILAILMLLSVLTTLVGPSVAGVLRAPVQLATAYLGEVGMYPAIWAREKVHRVTAENISQDDARRYAAENDALEAKVHALEAQLTDRLDQLRKIQQLRSLAFGPVEDIPCELIPARVVAGDSEVYGQTRVLRGASGKAGMPVTTRQLLTDRSKAIQPNQQSAICLPPTLDALSSAVLAGRLLDSGAFCARLQLVTDREFKISARIQRRISPDHPDPSRRALSEANIGLIGVDVAGDGKDSLTSSTAVKESDHVLVGDWLVTRSDEPLMPAQIRIGEVTEVTSDPRKAGFMNIKVRPSADLDTLREVYVVVPLGREKVLKN